MTDTRLAESFLTHPALDALSDAAHRVYVLGLVYAVSHGTDGRLPRRALRYLHPDGAQPVLVDELLAAGLWQRTGEDYRVRHFLRYQSSAEQVRLAAEARQAQRASEAERKREQRAKRKAAESPGGVPPDVPPDVPGDAGRDSTGQDSDRTGQAGQAPRSEQLWPVTARIPGSSTDQSDDQADLPVEEPPYLDDELDLDDELQVAG